MGNRLVKLSEATVGTKKSKVFSYIDPELKQELESLAAIRNRSVSNLMETMARQEIDRAKSSGELSKYVEATDKEEKAVA